MTPEPVVLLSALEHYGYCPRQCALIHVDGYWADNAHTVIGSHAHRRVDTGSSRRERGRRVLRGIPLHSERYGLSGRSDAVEVHDDGTLVPVEYKSGYRHGIAADLQLCGQAMCLEEMFGRAVDYGYVWYGGVRRRVRVRCDERLRRLALATVAEIRSMMALAFLPEAVADERCRECQLEPVCLPHVVVRPDAVREYVEREVTRCE